MSSPVGLPPPAAGRDVDSRAPVLPSTTDPACRWGARAPRLSRPRTALSAARAGAGGDELSCACETPACSSRCFLSTCTCRTDGVRLRPACGVGALSALLADAVLPAAASPDPVCAWLCARKAQIDYSANMQVTSRTIRSWNSWNLTRKRCTGCANLHFEVFLYGAPLEFTRGLRRLEHKARSKSGTIAANTWFSRARAAYNQDRSIQQKRLTSGCRPRRQR